MKYKTWFQYEVFIEDAYDEFMLALEKLIAYDCEVKARKVIREDSSLVYSLSFKSIDGAEAIQVRREL